MTITFDIRPDLIAEARRVTQARTDEEAVVRSVELLVGRRAPSTFDEDGGNPDDMTPFLNESGQYMTRAELDARRRRQAEFVPFLGTFESLASDEEFEAIRGPTPTP